MKMYPGPFTITVASLFLALGAMSARAQGALTPSAVAVDSPAAATARAHMSLQSNGAQDTLHIMVGQSTILNGVSQMRKIYVGNPAVLQTYTSGPEEVVVTGKAPGISSLVLWDSGGASCLYTVSVDIDPGDLRKSLDSAYPNNVIDVQGRQDRLMLSGVVPTPEVSDGAVKLAGAYTKDVVNSLRIVPIHGKQVQLKLRIAEADRSKLEQFGINLFRALGNNVGSLSTGQFASSITATPPTTTTPETVSTSNPLTLFLYNFQHNVGTTIQDLEQKQVLQILAEPTLTTMSGQPARFLSGGEFPFPVAQGGVGTTTAITIQFRPYGVKVDFTPTVSADGAIMLKISPEVSSLDYSNAVTISGFTVPALATRRAETEVELKDGQSFLLTGLLDRRVTQNLAATPGIASIPILGQLFRSKNNNHSVTELIMVVTVSIVDPLGQPATPIADPKWPTPNLDTDKFDQQLNKASKPGVIH
jgi:pilus assembly protein CpaC